MLGLSSMLRELPLSQKKFAHRAVAAIPIVLLAVLPAAAVQLTTQQEAFFPKNDPIDERIWKQFTLSGLFQDASNPTARIQYEFSNGPFAYLPDGRSEVCLALHRNLQLNHGELAGGCKIQLNPRLKQAKKFQFFEWKNLDPLQHLDVIRSMFKSLEVPQKDIYYNNYLPAPSWWKMAPVIKRLLERDAVELRVTKIDIASTGHPVPVYGLILHPFSTCLRNDLSTSSDYFLLHADSDDSISKEFNARAFSNSPFSYNGVVLIPIWQGGVAQVDILERAHGGPKVFTFARCEFIPK